MKKYPVTKPYFTDEEIKLISGSLDSGWVAQGPQVAAFERKIAEHEGVAEGVATTSCTTALHLAMVAQGLGEGMDAIAPAFTFVATENAIVMTGAVPVLCDVCRETFNIDADKLRTIVETEYEARGGKLINRKTGNGLWGFVPVHEFGLCCDIHKVNALAKEYDLTVIEDAACALGSMAAGRHQGAFGNTSYVSFHPRKSITTGEGGMILTDDAALAKKMRELRTHGSTVSADARDKGGGFLLPEFPVAGYNYRMTDIQGAMGLAQSEKLDYIIGEKRKAVSVYNRMIADRIPEFITPVEPEGYFHTYQSYVCMLDKEKLGVGSIKEGGEFRNRLLSKLEEAGIATRQGTHAVHTLGYYRDRFGYRPEDFPNAYECDRLSVALPLYVGLSEDDIDIITGSIRKVLDELRRI
ncbi:MAG: DegT/DnrJ/EryC1/StrS aminotransferase family protein [Lachnospiraceae bacterium]|nr:DegT/DnrJ/EryC1/StrS aminotransferase family protein [Lachnospiraceae bacterium]